MAPATSTVGIREFHALGLCRALDEKRQPGPSACSPAPRQGLRQAEQPDPEEQVMPEVVFVSTLEPKDGRRDQLVELLAELAKHIRGEPGYLQYSVHRPLGEDKGPLLVIQRYTSLEAYQEHSSWARGQAPRISELLATPPAPPVLFEPVPLGGDAAK
jgi:quinol monooxygenase YgiN